MSKRLVNSVVPLWYIGTGPVYAIGIGPFIAVGIGPFVAVEDRSIDTENTPLDCIWYTGTGPVHMVGIGPFIPSALVSLSLFSALTIPYMVKASMPEMHVY
jgi:hypothetical protein